MGTEANVIEYKKASVEKELQSELDGQEPCIFGMRMVLTNPIPGCEKIDDIFGSGGEAIIHYIWFEQGNNLFDHLRRTFREKTKDDLMKLVVRSQPQTGWGVAKICIIRPEPPAVQILVRNPVVKTIKGSQKHLIGAFWAGIFSSYFETQLTPRHFSYDKDKDEFSCVLTT